MTWGTRADLQEYVLDLWSPVEARLSRGRARAELGRSGATFSPTAAELEGFARPLWGLVHLAAGGGQVDWRPMHDGLISSAPSNRPPPRSSTTG
ncbi:DUF2264 domain-containing protein [Phytoactinopolyspora endophytica]|uniref:DUF2264 domain-containing protein n=1 Tax=Phytoactinopolyspora endophytica TaxID=1642495 RepID=UPI00101C5EF1